MNVFIVDFHLGLKIHISRAHPKSHNSTRVFARTETKLQFLAELHCLTKIYEIKFSVSVK